MAQEKKRAQLKIWSIVCPTNNTSAEEKKEQKKALFTWLKNRTKKWGFSLELGDEGKNIHWQIMCSLHKGTSLESLQKQIVEETKIVPGHISPMTVKNGSKFSYVTKPGALEGPWTDESHPNGEKMIPWDVAKIKKLRLFQAQIVEWALDKQHEECIVRHLYDPNGGIGKTVLKRYLAWHYGDRVLILPPMSDPKDLARAIHSMWKDSIEFVVIDIPWAFKCEKLLRKLYSGIESLKDGGAWDDRYKCKNEMFGPPKVLVLCNNIPKVDWMAPRRWFIWMVFENELQDVTALFKQGKLNGIEVGAEGGEDACSAPLPGGKGIKRKAPYQRAGVEHEEKEE